MTQTTRLPPVLTSPKQVATVHRSNQVSSAKVVPTGWSRVLLIPKVEAILWVLT